MSDMKMYNILDSFGGTNPKDNPTSSQTLADPIFESIDAQYGLVETVNALEEKYVSFKEASDNKDKEKTKKAEDPRGISTDTRGSEITSDPTVNKLLTKARIARPQAKSDLEAILYHVSKQDDELDRARDREEELHQAILQQQNINSEQEKRLRTINAKVASGELSDKDAAQQAIDVAKATDAQRQSAAKPTKQEPKKVVPIQKSQDTTTTTSSPKITKTNAAGAGGGRISAIGQYAQNIGKGNAANDWAKDLVAEESIVEEGYFKNVDVFINDNITAIKSFKNEAWKKSVQLNFPDNRQLVLSRATIEKFIQGISSINPESRNAWIGHVLSNAGNLTAYITSLETDLGKTHYYFYNVSPEQAVHAQSLGLKQSKSGNWYSLNVPNPIADKEFGPGKKWQPKTPGTPAPSTEFEIEESLGKNKMTKFNSIIEAINYVEEGKKLKDKKQFDDSAETGDYYLTDKGNKVIKTKTGIKHEKVHAADKEDDDDLEESVKPDFLDVDKDGNKKEPFKKAVKDKEQVEEATEFGDTIKNSEGKMTKVKVKEGKDAIRNHPIYTTKEAWDHYAQELAEQEAVDESLLEPVVDAVQELDEIAKLAGLTPKMESSCSSCGCADCKCESLDEAATRKDFRMVANLIKQIPDGAKRKELTHHHSGIFKAQNPNFSHEKFCKACGVDECDYNMATQPTAVIVGEEEMDEGNEFTKARLDAIAQGADTFSVSGKTYNVSGDTSNEKTQVEESTVVTEDVNVNVSASGEEDVVNLIRKLSGMPVIAIQTPQAEEACGTCGSSPCGCDQAVDEEREIELANTPHEQTAPIGAAIPSGGDLGRSKKMYKKEYPGDNPMAVAESEELWKTYESMVSDLKA